MRPRWSKPSAGWPRWLGATCRPSEAWQVVVMSQVAGGRELLLGARRDDSFGPVVAFGAGGVDTEILDDVALRLAPLNPAQARDLMAETRIGRILAGTRGRPPADLDSLSRALQPTLPIDAAISPHPGGGPQPGAGLPGKTGPPRPGRPDTGGWLNLRRNYGSVTFHN